MVSRVRGKVLDSRFHGNDGTGDPPIAPYICLDDSASHIGVFEEGRRGELFAKSSSRQGL